MSWNKFIRCFLIAMLAVAFWLHGLSIRRVAHIQDDAHQMMMMAYNLAHYGEFSDTECEPGVTCERVPSSYRGPGYPAFLAAGILLDSSLRNASQKDLQDSTKLDPLRDQALWLLFVTAALVGSMIWILTGTFWASFVGMAAVGFNTVLVDYQNEFYTEGLVAFQIVLTSLLLVLAIKHSSKVWLFLSGISAAALTLTNPIFYYSTPVVAVFILWAWYKEASFKRSFLNAAIYVAGFYLVAGPWMLRNYQVFDRAYISGRGGTQLYVRAAKDLMNADEYRASFQYWSNCNCLREKLEPIESNPRLTRLHRGFDTSFYHTARKRRTELSRELGQIEADRVIMKEAVEMIKANPLRHLAVTLPVALRGMGVQICGFDFVLFFSLFALGIWAVFKRNPAVLALTAPALFSFAFYAFFTYYIPRYSISLIPSLWASLIILLYIVSRTEKSSE